MTSTITTRGLVTTIDLEDRLVGGQCSACGTHTFPLQHACPRCSAVMTEVALPATGTVWSYTVQRIRPKPPYNGPEEFEPFALGYIDLGPVRVESRLVGRAVDEWQIGDAVRLTAGEADERGDVWSYRFEGVTS
jgi:uncharacterized OB-fold protein